MSENINEIAGVEPSFKIDELKFNEKGLIPAIVQDHYSKKVLMMAWMNKESLEISLREKKTCFYSRSRQELWRKGETSGNVQHISSIYADCDKDTLIVEVVKEGPACHTGADSEPAEIRLYQHPCVASAKIPWGSPDPVGGHQWR